MVYSFQNVFPIKTIQIIENHWCENNTQFPSTLFFYRLSESIHINSTQGQIYPPPHSDVQHSLEENSGIPYLSCEYYLLYWNLLPLNMRNTCKYCEGNLTNKRCVQNRDEPINR